MKRLGLVLIVVLAIALLSGCGQTVGNTSTIPAHTTARDLEPSEFNEWIKWSINKQYGKKANITKIQINDHMGTPDPDDKIALIYVDYTGIDTQKLKRFSDQMFKTVYSRYPVYQEFVVFWAPDGDTRATFKVYNERSETIYNP